MSISQKPAGSWYTVVLKTSAFSHARNFATGALGLDGTFPRPELGTRCVCCDNHTTERRMFDPSTDRIRAASIEIPVCGECDAHVPKSTNAAQFLASTICVGFALGLLGAVNGVWQLALAGGALCAVIAIYWIKARAKSRAMAERGHHTGLEVTVVHGLCRVRTTNHRLAQEIAERNEELVSRVR